MRTGEWSVLFLGAEAAEFFILSFLNGSVRRRHLVPRFQECALPTFGGGRSKLVETDENTQPSIEVGGHVMDIQALASLRAKLLSNGRIID